jgi:hypothetical protein
MTTTTKYSEIKQALIAQADAQHAQYPQYANYWDNWVVAKINKTIKLRGKDVAFVNNYVLVNPNSFGTNPESRFPNVVWCTAYFANHLGGCNAKINSNRLQIV